MPAILIAAFNWLFHAVVVKFVILSAILAAVSFLVPIVINLVSGYSPDTIKSALASLSPGLWYFLDLFRFSTGLAIVLSAMATKFLIRRLPVIG